MDRALGAVTGKIFSTPRLSQVPTITKPQSVSFRYSDLWLQRCRPVGAFSYLMAIAVVSSLCAQDSNNKSSSVDNSQLQKLVLSECLTSSGYATQIIPPIGHLERPKLTNEHKTPQEECSYSKPPFTCGWTALSPVWHTQPSVLEGQHLSLPQCMVT